MPTRSKTRHNPCLYRRTQGLEHTLKHSRPCFYSLTQLLPHSHHRALLFLRISREDGQPCLWQGAQVLQQLFSFYPASINLLSGPPPRSMTVCWLHSSGPAVLAHTEQQNNSKKKQKQPRIQPGVTLKNEPIHVASCHRPLQPATWVWIRVSEYVLWKKQTNVDYLTKVFPLGSEPLQTVSKEADSQPW